MVFDTRDRRHFLQSGDPQQAREYVALWLRELEQQRLSFHPQVPDGVLLYEWPFVAFPPPKFTWPSSKAERHLQLDAEGGQRIIQTDTIGHVICTNTDQLWN